MRCHQHIVIAFALSAMSLLANPVLAREKNNASPGNRQILTLQRAIQTALENNPGFQASQYATRAANWAVKKAHYEYLPKIAIDFNYARLDAATVRRANIFTEIGRELVRQFAPDSDPNDIRPNAWKNAFGASISLQQPIYNGGAIAAQVSMAQAAQSNSQHAYFDKRQDTILRTTEAFYNVLKAEDFYRLANKAIEATRRHLQTTRRMFEAGLRNRSEVLRWEVLLAEDEGHLVEAENGVQLARAALEQAMGVELYDSVRPAPAPDSIATVELAGLEKYLQIAHQQNPGLYAVAAAVDLRNAQIKLVRANFLPKVNLAYNYQWEKNNTLALDQFSTWSLGVGVQFPVFNGFTDFARMQEAKAAKMQAEEQKTEYENGLDLQVKQAYFNVRSAAKRLTITQKGVEQALENLRVVQNTFEVGMVANIDLLDAQIAALQAGVNQIRAKYDYLVAQARLRRATGTLDLQ